MPHQEIPWKQIYDLSLQCCKYRSTKSFSVSLLREMNRLVPFDEAVVFYLNGNLKITDYYLYNINPKWMSLYLGYYSNADRGAYGLVQRDLDNLDGVYVHQWSFEQSGEVIPDYIRPRNLVSTLGFPMRDATDRIRTIFALDRLSDAPYTDWEIETVRSIRELLKLFHRLLLHVRTTKPRSLHPAQSCRHLRRAKWRSSICSNRVSRLRTLRIFCTSPCRPRTGTFITSTKR